MTPRKKVLKYPDEKMIVKINKSLQQEMALVIKCSIACIENGILPDPKSPFLNRMKNIYTAYWRKYKWR